MTKNLADTRNKAMGRLINEVRNRAANAGSRLILPQLRCPFFPATLPTSLAVPSPCHPCDTS